MLRELHISNLAVIEDIRIELDDGLNCFTGQTGAGKSLILGAFELLLGLRNAGGADMIRPGGDEARVSGMFEIRDPRTADQIGAVLDLVIDRDEPLLITRRLFASGRSSVSVNGRPATSAMVRDAGELLVDVHGQHDHQYLLKPANQLLILDEFARVTALREQFGAAHAQLAGLIGRSRELNDSCNLRRQQLELYEFQLDEIDAAAPVAGEMAELHARHALLVNLQRIKRDAGHAHAALYEADGSVLERLTAVVQVLSDLAELDESLGTLAEQVKAATLSLQDSAFELGRYAERLELDPAEFGEVEDRLNLLNRLVSKYAGDPVSADDPIAQVLGHRDRIEQKIEQLRGENEDIGHIEAEIDQQRAHMTDLGGQLSQARHAAADKLAPLVGAELAELGMTGSKLVVQFTQAGGDGDGDGEGAASSTGMERIEMLVRTNPGQPARPLRKIASGGELSRIMLAIKSILAGADRISVLVFDEIDANIGGRLGTVIGAKLRKLVAGNGEARSKQRTAATRSGHQVLCITHLPQIAAFADRHVRIEKRVGGKGKARRASTSVQILDASTRVDELAEMIAGNDASNTTRKQARELIESASVQTSSR